MLDTDTKRRIDTARDILVGKVPDPKSQVEQITIALIYKFMDDMDAEAEEFGGKRKFFAKEFAKYGWAKLMRSGLGGHETLNLYAEAITKMPENPGIPLLFRGIFKNAYLPYRDPETLKMFLKVIDEFTYDHSERLGDAFEYLLSVLGSQGDAGQFRTPRHIIDFIVAVVDPQKHETILDPACGTAGFLISSYKHILAANTDKKGNSQLTPDEKSRLAKNFKGYDISPDMVRLSLVNLYLHGFTDPHIDEYDTLTSEDKWNEFADVILANPPFMSPKGGIKPHKRFSVQSKRSEVLFVDYMAEHLTPSGRAGIIVPEGIIFQSQTAYTELRRMLVETSLVAVVSLPAGVFNPYSGVKTSILLLDKSLSKQSDTLAFFKIENDGFGLGAQRREIEKNDIPEATRLLRAWLTRPNARESDRAKGPPPYQPGATPQVSMPHKTGGLKARPNLHNDEPGFQPSTGLGNHEPGALPQAGMDFAVGETDTEPSDTADIFQHPNFLIVAKEKIAENGDYNLSSERYRDNGNSASHKCPIVELGDLCTIVRGSSPRPQGDSRYFGGLVPRLMVADITRDGMYSTPKIDSLTEEGATKSRPMQKGDVIITVSGNPGLPTILAIDACIHDGFVGLRELNREQVTPEFLYYHLRASHAHHGSQSVGTVFKNLTTDQIREFKIPLPPLAVQQEIVAEIEGYQKVIDGARAVLDHYRPHIPIHPDWPMVELGDVIQDKPKNGYSGKPVSHATNLKVLSLSATTSGTLDLTQFKFLDEHIPEDSQCRCKRGDIYLQRGNTKELVGTAALFDADGANFVYPDLMIRVRADEEKILTHYLLHALQSDSVRLFVTRNAVGAAGNMPKINQGIVERIPIPLPPLATQQQIVSEIEIEQRLVAANRELIERFEQKIATTLARICGD